ncbi:MAG: glycoside hydrolase family 3 protein [Ignavibacteria bacterium]|nr:glycoside hydrolase family 3 protein [Ignavibacteria bacterium]
MLKFLIVILCICFISCDENKSTVELQKNQTNDNKNQKEAPKSETYTEERNDVSKKFELKDFYSSNPELDKKVDEVFSTMSDEDRIAQMIITSTGKYGKSPEFVLDLIKRRKIGGVVFLGGSQSKFKNLIQGFNKTAKESGSLPLIFSTDAEPSLINIKISGLEEFNPTNQIKTEKSSKESASKISSILNDLGINQNYAPVCDININKEIIGNRSFGDSSELIERLSSIFIETTQKNGIVATAKHFPGHGNVKGDSHKSLVYIDGELDELEVYENLINNSNLMAIPISIMVGHIAIKNNNEFDTYNYPSTLSKKIVSGLLKEKMKFKGIVITDGMNMGALNSFTKPSLQAVKAGCDMILMPTDEEQLLTSILSELKNPEFRNQINETVKKIIRAKVCLRLV